LLVAGDLCAAVLAYLLAFALRVAVPLPLTTGYLPALRFAEVNHHWTELLLGQIAALYFLGLYEERALADPRGRLGALVTAPVVQALSLIAVYFFRADLVFPRSIFVVFAALNAVFLATWRIACQNLMGSPRRRVLVVGTNDTAAEVIRTIRNQNWLHMELVGAVGPVSANGDRAAALHGVPVLEGDEPVPRLCERYEVDEVIIASEPSWQDRLVDSLGRWEGPRARIFVVPSPYEILIGRPGHLRLHDIPLIEVIRDPEGGGPTAAKRLFDVLLASVLLIPAVPVMLLVALAIRSTSGGPVLYHQTRVGRGGQPFTMAKFRTMREDAERTTGPVLASANDPRITALGRLLRATRLDELPQLLNVLRGDMSFVGPRPERPEFVEIFARDIQGYVERFRLRPGLTGYAQVNGEYHTSAATKLKYDLAYIHNRSLWLDLKILSDTVKVMLTRRGV
jgi:exopolysaccharide biosynthesis polyprenyl glycosylphosphotransferase